MNLNVGVGCNKCNITLVVIVKAPATSSRSIKLESEPAKKPDVIVSYDGIFTNKQHIKFHIAIVNSSQVHDVYALGTNKLGKWGGPVVQQAPGKADQIDQHAR